MIAADCAIYKSLSVHWSTSKAVYDALDAEFHFDDDPCPLGAEGTGLLRPWGKSTYCNPPYGRAIRAWLEHGINQVRNGATVVYNLPARTDTKWFHDLVLPYQNGLDGVQCKIRFVRGRLRFSGADNSAPFPSVILIYRPTAGGAA